MTKLGIIAEDKSDVDVIIQLIRHKVGNKYSFKHFVARGSGSIISKCHLWSVNLFRRGCTRLIVIRDADRKNPKQLESDIRSALEPTPIANNIIVIAVEEVESWLLSDMSAIHSIFSSERKSTPREIANPEKYGDAKQKLIDIVMKKYNSNYTTTVHNKKVAELININKIKRKCPSFCDLFNFI